MNKLSKILFILGIAMMVFSIGYKIGDARGYDAGYTEGYRYDCREEIGNLYEQVKNTKKAVEFTDKQLKVLSRENDSLRNPRVFNEFQEKYHEDTLKFGRIAEKRNDSLKKIGHPAAGFVSRQSGVVPGLVCYANKDNKLFADLPECRRFLEGRK